MEREEFYKTILVTPMNLVPIHASKELEKYDSWELLLTSRAGGKYIYGRLKCDPKSIGEDLAKLEFLQSEIDETVKGMYDIFLKETKEGERR